MSEKGPHRVVVVGGGFAGLAVAKSLGGRRGVAVTLIDRRNHHLFQPLLYQVAMAGLSPAQIAAPIRGLLARHDNVAVLQEEVVGVDLEEREVVTRQRRQPYDSLVLACGSGHSYFGQWQWEDHAPGLKTLAQATEIRRRVLSAFEEAESEEDPQRRRQLLTFVIVGGGPTGVELAGAIGEMSRFTLARDFRRIDPTHTRVVLVEARDTILPMFRRELANRAKRDLEKLGVQVWTSSPVKDVGDWGVQVGEERLAAATVLWAAGVQASPLGLRLTDDLDRQGRVPVEPDLSLRGHPEVFVLGDMARFVPEGESEPLPGLAPVAMQQGRYVGQTIRGDIAGRERRPFHYVDKGQMATIGRSRAIAQVGRFGFGGFFAWLVWLVIHIYYLTGFHNRLLVVIQWAWSYLGFKRGARLIVRPEWHSRPSAVDQERRDTAV